MGLLRGNNMSKINSRLSKIALILLIGLSACTVNQEPKATPPTDEQILEAVRDNFRVNDVSITLTDFELVSKVFEGIHEDVVTTFTLKNGAGTFDLKSTLRFLKVGSKYQFYFSENETLSAVVTIAPEAQRAMDILQHDYTIETYNNVWISETQMSRTGDVVCQVVEPDFSDGTVFVDCVENMVMLDAIGIGTVRFLSTYDFNKGWTYTYDSWTYVETILFKDPLQFKFPSIMNGTSPFKANETFTLNLEGSLVISYAKDTPHSVNNTLTGTINRNGVLTNITAELTFDEEAYFLSFRFGDQADDLLTLSVDSGGGRCGPASPPTYYLQDSIGNYAAWINALASGSVGIGTMSESECRVAN